MSSGVVISAIAVARDQAGLPGRTVGETEGTIAHHTYIERVPVASAGGGGGGTSVAEFDLTVVSIEVPDVADAIPKLSATGAVGPRAPTGSTTRSAARDASD